MYLSGRSASFSVIAFGALLAQDPRSVRGEPAGQVHPREREHVADRRVDEAGRAGRARQSPRGRRAHLLALDG